MEWPELELEQRWSAFARRAAGAEDGIHSRAHISCPRCRCGGCGGHCSSTPNRCLAAAFTIRLQFIHCPHFKCDCMQPQLLTHSTSEPIDSSSLSAVVAFVSAGSPSAVAPAVQSAVFALAEVHTSCRWAAMRVLPQASPCTRAFCCMNHTEFLSRTDQLF